MKTQEPSLPRLFFRWFLLLTGLLGLAAAALARGDELPGRVGRVVQADGQASIYDQEQDRWVEAQRNRALTAGDRLSTERGSRLQVGVGSTELRLSGDTELIFERLDDERVVLVLQHGSVAVRVRNQDITREIEVLAGSARAFPARAGHYRFDREGNTTRMTAWRGSLQLDTGDQRLAVDAGRSVELFREWRDGTAVTWGGVPQDAFSDWVARDEQRDDSLASSRHVSPEMTGADELDRHGRWERHPELGWVWLPLQVALDWTPFRHGRWTWHARWGWTWLDDAPWGFATSHYGRWSHWGGRWVWAPGAYVNRPVYAPALVGWVGGSSPSFGVSVSVGHAPSVGWFPLSPFDVYVPSFRHAPRYFDRVNQPHRRPGVPPQVPTGPVSYGNNGVPNAVTVVPSAVMQQRQPVAPAVIREGDSRRWSGGGEAAGFPRNGQQAGRMVPVPGGAVPVMPAQNSSAAPVLAAPGGGMASPSAAPVLLPQPPQVTVRSQPQFPQQPQYPAQAPTVAPQVMVPQVAMPQMPQMPQMQHSPQGREIHRQPAPEAQRPAARPVPAPVVAPMAPVRAPMAPVAAPMAPVRAEQPAARQRAPEQQGRREGRENQRERQERQ
jgi:hypothetical protein